MNGLLSLHLIAASRGDGLLPELRDALTRSLAIEQDPSVTDLARHDESLWVQAGPNPVGRIDAGNAFNVVQIGPRVLLEQPLKLPKVR